MPGGGKHRARPRPAPSPRRSLSGSHSLLPASFHHRLNITKTHSTQPRRPPLRGRVLGGAPVPCSSPRPWFPPVNTRDTRGPVASLRKHSAVAVTAGCDSLHTSLAWTEQRHVWKQGGQASGSGRGRKLARQKCHLLVDKGTGRQQWSSRGKVQEQVLGPLRLAVPTGDKGGGRRVFFFFPVHFHHPIKVASRSFAAAPPPSPRPRRTLVECFG